MRELTAHSLKCGEGLNSICYAQVQKDSSSGGTESEAEGLIKPSRHLFRISTRKGQRADSVLKRRLIRYGLKSPAPRQHQLCTWLFERELRINRKLWLWTSSNLNTPPLCECGGAHCHRSFLLMGSIGTFPANTRKKPISLFFSLHQRQSGKGHSVLRSCSGQWTHLSGLIMTKDHRPTSDRIVA